MPSFYEDVDGTRIHYEKVGTGQKVLLLIPGGIGASRIHYPDQLDGGLDQSLFTIIAIDLPGWGKSRPPERVMNRDTYDNDVRKAVGLMDKLGYKLYSVLGWSYGARVALLTAIRHQARVDKLVVWGAVPYANQRYMKSLLLIRDIENCDPETRDLHIEFYGAELYERLWHQHIDHMLTYVENPEALWDVREQLRSIRCPAMILNGDKDPMVDESHLSTFVDNIAVSQLVRFPKGKHNIHQAYVQEFNRAVTNFILE